jgi:hypothetical protein
MTPDEHDALLRVQAEGQQLARLSVPQVDPAALASALGGRPGLRARPGRGPGQSREAVIGVSGGGGGG